MAQIYCIYNDINDKLYIGKTNYKFIKRFNEHLNDSTKHRCEKRPLYNAMNKYGIEKFHVMLLEECAIEEAFKLEQEYIKAFKTFGKYGYNATIGGDGRSYVDYEQILELWNKNLLITDIKNITGHDYKTIKIYLINNKIASEEEIQLRSRINSRIPFPVSAYNKDTGNFIKSYPDIRDAVYDLNLPEHEIHTRRIKDAAEGKRKSAYGYKWVPL